MKLSKLLSIVKRTYNQLRGLLPSALPTGVAEFHEWADKIIATYDLPTKDEKSVKFLLASACINQQNPLVYSRPLFHFVKMVRHAANKQVAGAVFQEIKQAQIDADKAAKAAELTANESKQQAV